jgi:hypothetical protein
MHGRGVKVRIPEPMRTLVASLGLLVAVMPAVRLACVGQPVSTAKYTPEHLERTVVAPYFAMWVDNAEVLQPWRLQ